MEQREQAASQATMQNYCPICHGAQTQIVLALGQLPILANVLWDQREEALLAPRANITLAFCSDCGHVFNQDYDPRKINYDAPYENSLHFSPRFRQYANWLAGRLIEKYELRGKTIVEIGSGKGDFLRLLCDMGGNLGTGFDPSYQPDPEDQHEAVSIIRDVYSERYADYPADLILSRHVLEHIYHPTTLLQDLRRTIGEQQAVVFFEVPNLSYILRDTAVWDIIYEHYSYFSPDSLTTLFAQNGFNVIELVEVFEGQFLTIEANPRDPNLAASIVNFSTPKNDLAAQVAEFSQRSLEKIERWRTQIQELQQNDKRAVIWGAGSKGISLLNMLNIRDEIPYIIDINPRKRNKYVTGSGQQIVPPAFLQTYQPDTIIIMNPVYQQEIQRTVEQLGLQVDFMLAT